MRVWTEFNWPRIWINSWLCASLFQYVDILGHTHTHTHTMTERSLTTIYTAARVVYNHITLLQAFKKITLSKSGTMRHWVKGAQWLKVVWQSHLQGPTIKDETTKPSLKYWAPVMQWCSTIPQTKTLPPPLPKTTISQVTKCKHYNSTALTPLAPLDAQQANANFDVLISRMLTLCSRATTKVVFFCYPVRSPVATFVVFSRAVLWMRLSASVTY
jgi:hypothetical protein